MSDTSNEMNDEAWLGALRRRLEGAEPANRELESVVVAFAASRARGRRRIEWAKRIALVAASAAVVFAFPAFLDLRDKPVDAPVASDSAESYWSDFSPAYPAPELADSFALALLGWHDAPYLAVVGDSCQ